MDDYLKSMLNEKGLISLTCKVVYVLKCNGFSLKKLISNSETVLQSLPPSASKICELRIPFANIRMNLRTNLEYSEGHIYFQTNR